MSPSPNLAGADAAAAEAATARSMGPSGALAEGGRPLAEVADGAAAAPPTSLGESCQAAAREMTVMQGRTSQPHAYIIIFSSGTHTRGSLGGESEEWRAKQGVAARPAAAKREMRKSTVVDGLDEVAGLGSSPAAAECMCWLPSASPGAAERRARQAWAPPPHRLRSERICARGHPRRRPHRSFRSPCA